jgi:predicted HTH domain antitoxin
MTITIEFSEQLNAELEVIPKTGHYTSTSEFLKDAIKTILAVRKDLRVSIAIELYKTGYSLGRIAEIADLDYEVMKEMLVKNGIEMRRGAETVEELETGARMLREFRMKR